MTPSAASSITAPSGLAGRVEHECLRLARNPTSQRDRVSWAMRPSAPSRGKNTASSATRTWSHDRDVEVLRGRVVADDGRRALFGLELELLAERDADARRL